METVQFLSSYFSALIFLPSLEWTVSLENSFFGAEMVRKWTSFRANIAQPNVDRAKKTQLSTTACRPRALTRRLRADFQKSKSDRFDTVSIPFIGGVPINYVVAQR